MAVKNVKTSVRLLPSRLKDKNFSSVTFSKTNILVFALIFASLGGYLIFHSRAASFTLTVNGNTKYQTMSGMGAAINVHSWDNGKLKPALDMMVDQNGTQTFRVVMEMTDWEQTNDNSDPNTMNWTYYDPIYSGATSFDTGQNGANFADLWNTIDYLHQKGIPDSQIILSFMGIGPNWNGGTNVTTTTQLNEWVESVVSAAYWGYSHGHTFGVFSPDNEEDWAYHEGVDMSMTMYADGMNKIAQRLDTLGMSSVRLLGPETSGVYGDWSDAMASYPLLLSKIDHFDYHNYSGLVGNEPGISAAYGKDFWISEFSVFDHTFDFFGENAPGFMMWDAYDSVYNHAMLNNLGNQPGNDKGDAPAWIAYDSGTKTYTPRKSFYQFGQVMKWTPIGSVRIGATESNANNRIFAFYHQASGRVTIVGQNTGSTNDTITTTLSNLPSIPSFEYYTTTNSANMQRGADVTVTGGNTFTFTAPANGVYTLTYGPSSSSDSTPPTTSLTAPSNGATVSGANVTLSANAADNIAVNRVEFYVDGNLVGTDTTSPYSVVWDSRIVANGSHTVQAKAYDSSSNLGSSNLITITSNNSTACSLSTASWQNTPFASQNGSFTFDFDATPSAAGVDAVTGLSNGAASGYSSLAVIARFNSNGTIDAINGSSYAAANTLTYSVGTSYHFKATVNTAAHTYTLTVTPAGGSATTIASNYAFRTEQASVSLLNNWSIYALTGSHTVCGATIGSTSPTPTATLSANPTSISSGSSSTLTWSSTNATSCTASNGWSGAKATSGSQSVSPTTTTTYSLTCTGAGGTSSPASATVTVTAAAKTGDLNTDGNVNIFDLSILLTNYGKTAAQASTPACDMNSDGNINIFDLSILLSHYGT